jgi:diguanylate cyclase (GGDEF)-like protein
MQRLVRSADRLGRDASVRSFERVGGSRDVMVLSNALRALLRRVGNAQEQASAARRAREAAESQAGAEQRRLAEQLDAARNLAECDPLTGLLNRRGFAHYAEDAWQTWRRHRRPLAVLVVDVDHFKAINDRFGHAVGDSALASLGRIIAATVRTTDKAARFGGEEFVALLRETDRDGALILAERLRAAVAEGLSADAGLEQKVTVSLGVAPARPEDRDLGDVIQRADRALYAAKLAGRDRVEVEDGQVLHAGAA